MPLKNDLPVITSVTRELHQVEVGVVWGLGSFYQCSWWLEHSSITTGQGAEQWEEKGDQGPMSTMGGRMRRILEEEKLQEPSRRAQGFDEGR